MRHIDSPKELASSDFLQWMLDALYESIEHVSSETLVTSQEDLNGRQAKKKEKHLLPFFEQWLGMQLLNAETADSAHITPSYFARAQATREICRLHLQVSLVLGIDRASISKLEI